MPLDRWLAAGALLLFIASLTLPAIDGAGFPAFSGFDVLRQGAGAWRDGIVAWYANPVFFAAWIAGFLRHHRLALAAAAVGLLLALSSFTAGTIAAGSGRTVPEFGFGIGFYLWLGAFVALILASGVGIVGAEIYKESGGKRAR